jgi:preprotein translocase subunit SecG
MYTLFTILIILICVLLVLIVLIQKPKGGGLNPNFAGSSQLMGVKKTTDVVERSTWMLSLALLVFTLMINMWIDRGGEAQEATQLREKAESAAVGLPGPGAPAPAAPGGATPVEPGQGTPSPAAPGGATPAQSGQGAAPGQ